MRLRPLPKAKSCAPGGAVSAGRPRHPLLSHVLQAPSAGLAGHQHPDCTETRPGGRSLLQPAARRLEARMVVPGCRAQAGDQKQGSHCRFTIKGGCCQARFSERLIYHPDGGERPDGQ